MNASRFRNHLIGTWSLQSYTSTSPTGTSSPFGPSPQGFIMYSPDGNVSVHMQKPGQAPYKSEDLMGATTEEAAESARGYQGYCGPFKVVEDENGRFVLWHTMELSFFPNWKGETQKRLAKLDFGTNGESDTLTLSTDGTVLARGEQKSFELVWKRKV